MSLSDAFAIQARACAALGSPFTARFMTLCAERLDRRTAIGARLHDWPGEVSNRGASVPLRLAGSLHRLVLEGAAPELAAVWPPHDPGDDALWAAIAEALERHRDRLDALLDCAPQTNEVRRSAVLIPVMHALADRFGLPLTLSELGASGGLNLLADRFLLDLGGVRLGPADATVRLTPEWRGPPPRAADLRVADRAGVDLAPVDPGTAEGRLTLLSYLWPDQPERLARTDAAIALRDGPAPVAAGDAAPWLERRLAEVPGGTAHLVYHTVAWQYFPPETQARAAAALEAAGAAATDAAPLARLAMETDGVQSGARLTLTVWPGGEPVTLGRADFHGRWVDWRPPDGALA
ncbi:DUF2332 family protein [Rhodobacteraceae bacterium CCMM004]|nr:DUF2332 family protein [Rhodobacteraceae bacterium CCMM004]